MRVLGDMRAKREGIGEIARAMYGVVSIGVLFKFSAGVVLRCV